MRTKHGMYVRDGFLEHAVKPAAVVIPAVPRDEARRERSRCLCDLGRANCSRETKKSITCRVWHSVAPQGYAAPKHKEDSGGPWETRLYVNSNMR